MSNHNTRNNYHKSLSCDDGSGLNGAANIDDGSVKKAVPPTAGSAGAGVRKAEPKGTGAAMALKLKLDEVREESERAQRAKRNADAYAGVLGGQLVSRITVPLTNRDDILRAAATLRELAGQLEEIADAKMHISSRLMAARSHCYVAHRTLKGGARWNGTTR